MNSEVQPGFYEKTDLRSENRELAFKLFFRELQEIAQEPYPCSSSFTPKTPRELLRDLIKRWGMREEEIGTRLSLAITFPDGLMRNQWFYDEKGNPYSLKHDGLPPKKPKSKSKPKPKRKK